MPVGKTNRDKVRQQAADERELRAGGNTFFKFKDGKNRVRILPPPPDSDIIFLKTATHWGVGPNNLNINAPVDEKGRVGGWLTEKAHALQNSKKADEKKLGEEIRAKKQWIYNVVDIDDLAAGMQVMSVGIKLHEQILAYLEDEDEEYGAIEDLDEGYVLTITKSGTGRNTEYKVKAAKNPTPIPDEIRELLEQEDPTDLTTVRPVASDDDMKKAFFGEEDDAEEDDDDDDEDATPAVKRRGRAAPVEEDDDEDEDEEEEEEEDEEDEEDDDEEEEEQPKKPARRLPGKSLRGRSAGRKK